MRPPDDAELLAYLDGELSPDRRASVEQMLEASWEVRARLAAIERDIAVFVKATEAPAVDFPSFDQFWPRLQSAASNPHSPAKTAPAKPSFLRTNWRRLAAAGAAAALVIAAVVKLNAPPEVSAKVLLGRAKQAETQEIARVKAPVIYQKLRLQKRVSAPYRSEAVVWELWRPVAGGVLEERVASGDGKPYTASGADVYSEFRRICDNNRLDRTRPLSPEAYEDWHSRAGARWGNVLRQRLPGGDRVYVLEAIRDNAGAGEIMRSSLIVREDTGRPVGQRLSVRAGRGADEYELAEDAYRIIARTNLPADVLPQMAPLLLDAAPAELAALPSVEAVPALPPVPPAELAASAVEVHFVLHRMGLCHQQSLELNRTASGMELRGSADSEQHRQTIAAAVAHVPHLRFEMTVGRGPAPGARAAAPRAAALDRYIERASAGRPHADLRALHDSAVALNAAVSDDARALRRLARTFSSEDIAVLPIASRWLLNQMFHEHLTALRKNSGQLGSLLLPVMGAPGDAVEEYSRAVSEPDWRSRLVAFCDRVEVACGLLRDLADGPSDEAETAVRSLIGTLLETPADAAAIESALAARLTRRGTASAAVQENTR